MLEDFEEEERKKEDIEDLETKNLRIDYRFYETSIREINSWNNDGDIEFNAEYQRGVVWNQKMASRFIESILWGLPIPGIILVKMDDVKFEVLDGKQRLTSILDFINGRPFNGGKREFKLKDIKKFEGKSFKELDELDQKKILRTKIFVTQINTSTSDNKAIYSTFERINTGGLKLHPQNIRLAIYNSKLMKKISVHMFHLLEKGNSKFSKKDIAQGLDVELILRILSVFFIKNSKKIHPITSTKKMIDDFSEYVYYKEQDRVKKCSKKNIFINSNFYNELNDVVTKLLQHITDSSELLLKDKAYSKAFKNLHWESFFVALLEEKHVNDINKQIQNVNAIDFSRSEDSNWYNHTNNWVKVLGRIQEMHDILNN